MSIAYSDVTNKDGLLQQIEQSCGFDDGGISGNAVLKAQFTGKINTAQDEAFAFALSFNGWNVDDFNHTKDPFITIDLVSGRRDYHFTTDQEGSLVLNIYKVMIKDVSGVYREIYPVDQQSDGPSSLWDGQNTYGTPTTYDKTGNGLFFNSLPNATNVTLTAGLKLLIDRESTYFVVSDTTKISGLDGVCHDYLYLRPSYEYARDKGLQNRESLFRDKEMSMLKIKDRYGSRQKDISRQIVGTYRSSR